MDQDSKGIQEQLEEEVTYLKERLEEATRLLVDARSLMNNTHCYATDEYREIGVFLYGEEEDE